MAQTLHRIRFVEKIHEDGVMAMEVVVNAETELDAVARATRIIVEFGGNFTWVEWVCEGCNDRCPDHGTEMA